MESPVQARYQYGRKIRHAMGRRDVERILVAKPVSHAQEKPLSFILCARTVNRHRWMRRES